LVLQDLVKAAAALLGRPTLPVPGNMASDLAVKFASSNPKAAPANTANALIAAYCTAVTATASVEQAAQRAWVQDFGAQVIQPCRAARSLPRGDDRSGLRGRFRRGLAAFRRWFPGPEIERYAVLYYICGDGAFVRF
jgi:hypothetical protein